MIILVMMVLLGELIFPGVAYISLNNDDRLKNYYGNRNGEIDDAE